MKRFFFTLIALLLIGGFILSGCKASAPASAPASIPASATAAQVTSGKPIELTFAYWAASQATISKHLWNWWPTLVEQATGGRVHINIRGDSSMGTPQQHYDLVKSGTADIANISAGFTPGQFPLSEIAGLPMLFPNSEVAASALYRFHEKYTFNTEFKDVKVISVACPGNNDLVSKKPVKTLEDLKGMKVCASEPLDVKVLQALGASPVQMARGEIYTSLERGLVDGNMSNPNAMVMFKDMEVTKYRTFNVHLSMNTTYNIMNLNTWNKLPPDIQNILTGLTGLGFSQLCGITFDTVQAQMLQQVLAYDKKVGNPDPYYLPDDERARWIEAAKPVVDAWVNEKEAAGLPARAALADLRSWVAEYSKIFLP